jgi:hypothetical protein
VGDRHVYQWPGVRDWQPLRGNAASGTLIVVIALHGRIVSGLSRRARSVRAVGMAVMGSRSLPPVLVNVDRLVPDLEPRLMSTYRHNALCAEIRTLAIEQSH